MITSIIFSKNRACQLDLLLRSMQQNLPNFQKIFVLWHATTQEFIDGYTLLGAKHNLLFNDQLAFVQQNNFQNDTFKMLKMVEDYVCFFVDDNIIYRPHDIDHQFVDRVFNCIPELTCFTLRLGTNTVVQDQYHNQPTVFPENIMVGNVIGTMIYLWDWQTVKVFGDFGYPFSVDGHIYKVSDLLPLLNYEFDTPNAFEGRFNKNLFTTNTMACFEQSVLVNNPINIVGSSNNNAGIWYGHTLEELNQKYLDGYQISLNSIMEKEIFAAHQEIEVEFEKV